MLIINAATNSNIYPIYIGAKLLASAELLTQHLRNSRVLIVTDQLVASYYLDALLTSLSTCVVDVLILDAGETNKNWPAVDKIINTLVQKQHDRFSTLIALGGGVVGDLAGFAAAIFMRGMNLIQIPTSLLAQVDASVGGKTGFNHLGSKNLIGTFYQPSAVIIDCSVLTTLSAREYVSGLAEIVKYGMACDANFFQWLEAHAIALQNRDQQILEQAIQRSCELKLQVVAQDERDEGQRLILNFGHTFAHALEAVTDFKLYLHGEAVALGMLLATWLAVKLGMVRPELLARLQDLLQILGLPLKIDYDQVSIVMLYNCILLDKKKNSEQLALILPCALGKVKVFRELEVGHLKDLMEEYAVS